MTKRVLALVCLASTACGPKPKEENPDIIQSRVAPCREWCKVQADPECGVGPTPAYDDLEGCVDECATPDGDVSSGWGYQAATKRDACAAEWTARKDCLVALSCETQKFLFSEEYLQSPEEDRPCWQEFITMSECAYEAAMETQ
jgi:hypothetical protein